MTNEIKFLKIEKDYISILNIAHVKELHDPRKNVYAVQIYMNNGKSINVKNMSAEKFFEKLKSFQA